MAINELKLPDDLRSAHDDLWCVAGSDNALQVDFKYVFDVYANGKQLIRAKIYPDPQTNLGYFNISNILSNQMQFDWFEPKQNFVNRNLNSTGEIFLGYQVQVGEDVAGVTTTNMDSGIGTVANCIPNLFGRQRTNKSTLTSLLNNTTTRFLTNRDKVVYTKEDEDFYIGCCLVNVAQGYYSIIRFKQYATNGQTLSEDTLFSYNTTIYTDGSNIFQLNISQRSIKSILGNTIFHNSMSYYEIELVENYGATAEPQFIVRDKIRVYIDCVPKYQTINLHFMNNYGLIDTARFNLASRLTMDAERKTFEKSDYRMSGNSVTYYNQSSYTNLPAKTGVKYHESKINYGSKYQWSYKLTMDFPSDNNYEWLAELVMSPQVWAEFKMEYNNTYSEFYPVGIKATNYEYSTYINNRLRAFEVEIDMNQKRNGFRR